MYEYLKETLKLLPLVVFLSPVFWAIFKQYQNSDKSFKALTDTVREAYDKVSNFEEKQNAHFNESCYIDAVRRAIQKKSLYIITFSKLSAKHNTILNKWSKWIEELGADYCKSQYRGIKHEMKCHLENEFSCIETFLKEMIKQSIKESKNFVYDTGKQEKISFYDFVTSENRGWFKDMNVLKLKLLENGFEKPEEIDLKNMDKPPKLVTTMDELTEKILSYYIDTVLLWLEPDKQKNEIPAE